MEKVGILKTIGFFGGFFLHSTGQQILQAKRKQEGLQWQVTTDGVVLVMAVYVPDYQLNLMPHSHVVYYSTSDKKTRNMITSPQQTLSHPTIRPTWLLPSLNLCLVRETCLYNAEVGGTLIWCKIFVTITMR